MILERPTSTVGVTLDQALASVALAWKGKSGDLALWGSQSSNGERWSQQRAMPARATSHGPALTSGDGLPWSNQSEVLMAWKGIEGDAGLYWSRGGPHRWSSQERLEGTDFATSHGPALAVVGPRLMIAFRRAGVHLSGVPIVAPLGPETFAESPSEDARLFWATYDGTSWAQPSTVTPDGVRSSHGPALVGLGRTAVMAWKGAGNQRIHWSFFDGRAWSKPAVVPGVGTLDRPALASLHGRVYMAWRGSGDLELWWSQLHEGQWAPQQTVGGASTHGPALAVASGRLVLVWKGKYASDERLYHSSSDGTSWTAQKRIEEGFLSSEGPALASYHVPRIDPG